jgi:D-beta-D-heptose 7-phosphate kinase/D-beta-D-heptose 1-phosphate adenosyltransferase
MIDRYVYGEVGRISPEAPIPVLLRASEQVMLGGVGNVARNVAGLGGRAALVGVIGNDAAGHETTGLIGQDVGLEGHLVVDMTRPTTVKTRFVASGQQLLRLDSEQAGESDRETEGQLRRAVGHAAESAGAILLSDYAKGAVTPGVIEACLRAAKASGAKLIVDAKARSLVKYGAADLIKPNALELHVLTGMPTDTDEEVEAALAQVLGDLGDARRPGHVAGRTRTPGAPCSRRAASGVRRVRRGRYGACGLGPGAGGQGGHARGRAIRRAGVRRRGHQDRHCGCHAGRVD